MSTFLEIKDYWDWFFEQYDYKNIFVKDLSRKRMSELFAKYVKNINIETSAFCNRKCDYCPLSQMERKQSFMSDDHWNKIVKELKEVKYCGRITLCLYNEPLLDKSIPQKIHGIRENLPGTLIALYSNGDYLNNELLDMLIDNGLNWLLVTRHVSQKPFSQSVYKKEVLSYIQTLGLEGSISEYKELNDNNVSYVLNYRQCELYIVTNNWNVIGSSRGGVIEELNTIEVRNTPCAKAIRDFNISYDGIIKPCCETYFNEDSDFGTIEQDGILNSYFNNLRDFRLALVKFGDKKGGCKYCGIPDNARIDTKLVREEITGEQPSCVFDDARTPRGGGALL